MYGTSEQNGQRFVKVLASLCRCETLVEILLKPYVRPCLETISFVDGSAKSVTHTVCQGDIVSDLPNVLTIDVVLFGRETADNRATRLLRRAINIEVEVRGVLRQPAEHSRKRMSRVDEVGAGDGRAHRLTGKER